MIIFGMFFFIFAMIHTDCIEGSNRNSLKQSILLCLCTLSYSFSLRFMLYTFFFALTAYCLIVFGDLRSQISLKKRNSLRDYSNQPQGDSGFIDMRYHIYHLEILYALSYGNLHLMTQYFDIQIL